MRFQLHSHRHAETILRQDEYWTVFNELLTAISSISEEDLAHNFTEIVRTSKKSLSQSINSLIRERLGTTWKPESPIFQESEYKGESWRLDFAKPPVSVEVAFNHGEAIAWNLLKPVLASELNHVEKAIQTEIGVIICATDELKKRGGFDSAVGSYEKFIRYLRPLQDVLVTPILIIGLEAPVSFKLDSKSHKGIIIYEPDSSS
jgi:hypothetical protein